MISRTISAELRQLLREYPIVSILGPRQAGKTTLAKSTLKGYAYCNLEIPENRYFAEDDPKAFLAQFKGNVILDEIQRVPQLLSDLQGIVDERQVNGQFVLTGSHQLELAQAMSQSLAGRVGILKLLPLSIDELDSAAIRFDRFEDYAFTGFLPRIHDQQQRPTTAYSNYYQTYVERDVRQLINIRDLSLFEKFIKLLAGRTGQLVDHTSLGNDTGVNSKTIRNWLSILEASFIIFKLPPYFENFGKRTIKAPKYYFTDVGLLTFLLGIEDPSQISRDPIVGNIFENLVVVEALKARLHQGKLANLYFFRDSNGNEIDLLVQNGPDLIAIEIKACTTYSANLFKNIDKIKKTTTRIGQSYLVYNGHEKVLSHHKKAIRFNQVKCIFS